MNDDTPGIDELFAIARDARAPAGAAARGWSGLQAAVGATPAAAAPTSAAWLPAAKIGGIVAVVIAIAVPLATREDAGTPTTAAAVEPSPIPKANPPQAEIAAMPTRVVDTTLPSPVVANEVSARSKPSRASTTPIANTATTAPVPTQSPDALRLEADLLGRAWVAIETRDLPTTRTLLAEHADRFPNGALVPERRACEVVAACLADERDATTSAERYLAAHGASHLAARVRSGCGLSTESTAR